jgi:dodecin
MTGVESNCATQKNPADETPRPQAENWTVVQISPIPLIEGHPILFGARLPACNQRSQGAIAMTQKVIEVVGTSKESFAKAAENAVREAAKTVRGMKWARVAELEMELDGKKIAQYRATTKIYFDIEH